MKSITSLALIGCLLCASHSQAEVNFFIDAALAVGGDEIAEVEIIFDDEDDNYDEDLDAGEGFVLTGGIAIDLPANFRTDLALGYKDASVYSDGDSVTFDRFLASAMLFYGIGPVYIGAGVTQEFNGEIDLKDAGGPRVDTDDATGAIIAANFLFDFGLYVGAKYTMIDYEIDDSLYYGDFDGDNFAVVVGYQF